MIHTHTMTQLKTVQNPLQLASSNSTNLSVLASSTYTNNLPTTTTAVPTVSAGGVIVPSASLNYVKIVPVFKTGVVAPKFKVTGWNKIVNASNVHVGWVPQCLFEGSVTLGTNAITINSASDFRVALTIAKNFGDAKIYNATTVTDTGFVLVDTLGCELVEIEFVTSGSLTANAANAFIGAI
jgi:hypothetical protein